MANAVNNDPGRVRPVENYVRVRNYHETAEGACSGTFTGHALPTWRGLLRPSRSRHARLRPARRLGACPNSRCSNLRDSDSTFGYEQVFSSLEYRSNAAAAAERAGLRAERPCLAIYR